MASAPTALLRDLFDQFIQSLEPEDAAQVGAAVSAQPTEVPREEDAAVQAEGPAEAPREEQAAQAEQPAAASDIQVGLNPPYGLFHTSPSQASSDSEVEVVGASPVNKRPRPIW